ncbi:type II toxin-antitoxin system Phd/YefM family antitoxin [Streptomyces sp. NPDC002851]
MAYEIPVTQARAELADLINRVVYGGERVVVTRHGKPLVALVSADDLRRLEESQDQQEHPEHAEVEAEAPVISAVSSVGPASGGPGRGQHRFGVAAEHRGPNPA